MPSFGWSPALILAAGSAITFGLGPNRIQPQPLRQELVTLPTQIEGFQQVDDLKIPDEERKVAGMDSYLLRRFAIDSGRTMSVYVGYYEKQVSGKAIHSPKNCLPGAGWEPLDSKSLAVTTSAGAGTVNRYLLQKGAQRALVLYWYQGRGRVEASEYRVKWNLLKDAAIQRRSDEALVRIVLPLTTDFDTDQADPLSLAVAQSLIPEVASRLPGKS